MKIVHTISILQAELTAVRKNGKSIGLVPTMGALHAGHASLVKRSAAENDVTVVSIFVNPTQFNDQTDLKKYPRTPDADFQLLESVGATFAFVPSVEEIYPEPDTRKFDFSPLDKVMEGPRRPGHFNGVGQIVSKLFYLIEPDRAYFGEKDFQQVAIIRKMVQQLKLKVKIVSCPIIREKDGLALSSRNKLISEENRATALMISKILFDSQVFAKQHSLAETKTFVENGIANTSGLELEYYEIVNGNTLQTVHEWEDAPYIVGCITVHCGSVRLIDNIKYKEKRNDD